MTVTATHDPLVWTPQRVLETSAEAFGVLPVDILGRSHEHPLVDYRKVTYAAVRRFCGLSYPATGRVFRRDHTTVRSGIKDVESNDVLRGLYVALAERLLSEGVG